MIRHDTCVVIFTKSPVAGQVKTRLLPELDPEKATALYCELIDYTASQVADACFADIQIWSTPDKNHPFICDIADRIHASRHIQTGDDLGERMLYAIEAVLQQYRAIIIIGCDCPELTSKDIIACRDRLKEGHDIVLGPSDDGGYYLIGCTEPYPDLFKNIPWGTDSVFELTLDRIKSMGLSYSLLEEKWDLDTPTDLKRYERLINQE